MNPDEILPTRTEVARNATTLGFLAGLTTGLALALLLAALIGCGIGYVRAGDPCTTIGDTARNKAGYAMVCKAPTTTDPTNTPRWRRA